MRSCSLRRAVIALALAAGQGTPVLAQESTGGAVTDEGSVVEGASGGIDVGLGAAWLGLGALVALGLAVSIAASDSDDSGATGTTGTTGTSGTSGSN